LGAIPPKLFGVATAKLEPRPPHYDISRSNTDARARERTRAHDRTPLNVWPVGLNVRYLHQHTINTRGEHPCNQQDMNLRSQQSSRLISKP